MSEPAAAAHVAPTETQSSTQQTPAASAATESQADPQWLPARLERERKTIAKKLGVESLDELEAFVKEARELKQSQMSEAEKLRARVAELEGKAKDRDDLASSLGLYAKAQLEALTPEQRAAVEAIAGESPSAIVRTIESLKPTWKAAAAAAPTPPAPLPAPASTAPATSAPAATAAVTTNHRAVWEQLKASGNAMRAAEYLLRHEAEIVKARQAG